MTCHFRALLDSADRGKRQTEAELGEARVAVNDMSTINSKANAEKRNLGMSFFYKSNFD